MPEQSDTHLRRQVRETREWLEINGNPDATDKDAIEHMMGECGMGRDGYCSMAGSEHCDFECAFSR